jgi:hypothetical protein
MYLSQPGAMSYKRSIAFVDTMIRRSEMAIGDEATTRRVAAV